MTERLSQDEVAHVAHLARIDLNEDELRHFADHLGKILEHASELDSLDLRKHFFNVASAFAHKCYARRCRWNDL